MQQARAGRLLPVTLGVAAALAASGCISVHVFDGGVKPLVESVVRGESGPKILLLDIDGTISEFAQRDTLLGLGGENMVSRVREQLDRAREDDQIRALLVRVNSPGGTVTASDIVYREILRFKRDRDVPVVAQLMSVAASGGYYVAMGADRLIAYPTTVTGSIGVILVGVNLSGLMSKLGIEDQTLRAGAFKDAGSLLRPMKPAERSQLQSVLDDMHARFKRVVAKGRPDLDEQQIDRLADGRIFSAEQALENGLVDSLGDVEDAIAETEKLAGLPSSRVVSYHRPREWVKNFYARPLVPAEVTIKFEPPLQLLERPGFFYLWAPGLR